MEWKRRFDSEMAEKNSSKLSNANATKPTGFLYFSRLVILPLGRQLFERDSSLAISDATFFEEGDVTVDVALFERELENLDIGDEEDFE